MKKCDWMCVVFNVFMCLCFCMFDGVMEFKVNGGFDSVLFGYLLWFDVFGCCIEDVMVVFGYWVVFGLMLCDNVVVFDLGCVWGN